MSGEVDSKNGSACLRPAKPWEYAWSVAEMRKAAPNWKLSCDVGMLYHIQDFSQRMMSRTHNIQEQLNAVIHEAKLTNVRVNNAFNEFNALANTQFVENRVYDEDVSRAENTVAEKNVDEKERSKETSEAQLISRIKEAVNLGLSVLDTDYDKLGMNVDNSESDDDEGGSARTPQVIWEPKDPYLHRPLPYLIGSDEFNQSDDVGLRYNVAATETEDVIEPVSTISDVTTQQSRQQDETTGALSSRLNQQPSSDVRRQSMRDQTDDEDDTSSQSSGELFAPASSNAVPTRRRRSSDTSSQNTSEAGATQPSSSNRDFNSELAARIGARPSTGPEGDAVQQPAKHRRKPADDMFSVPFGNGSQSDSDADDIFKKPTGLFSASSSQRTKLFGDDDDDDDKAGGMFGSAKATVRRTTVAESDVKAISDTSGKPVTTPTVNTTSAKPAAAATVAAAAADVANKGLFDDDEDDLFSSTSLLPSSKTTPAGPPTAAKKETKRAGDLFAEVDDADADDLFQQQPTTASTLAKQKKPAGAVPVFMFGDDEQLKAEIASTHRGLLPARTGSDKQRSPNAGDSGDKPQLQRDDKAATDSKADSSVRAGATKATQPVTSSGLLFEDESDLFNTLPAPKAPTSQPTASKPKINLFSDDDEEGDLFSSMSKAVPTKSAATAAAAAEGNANSSAGKMLKTSEATAQQQPQPVSKSPAASDTKPPVVVAANKVLSLFDDDNDNDSEQDLFSSTQKRAINKEPVGISSKQQQAGTLSLFGDDLLFASSTGDVPSVDLFGSTSPLATPQKSATAATSDRQKSVGQPGPSDSLKPDAVNASSRQVKLFGDNFLDDEDNDEDLFSAKKTSTSKQVTTKATPSKGQPNNETGASSVSSDRLSSLSLPQPSTTGGSTVAKSATSDTTTTVSGSTIPVGDSAADKNKGSSAAVAAVTKPSAVESHGGKIAQLQSSLAIDPTALLPSRRGMIRPANRSSESEIAAVEPVEAGSVRPEPVQPNMFASDAGTINFDGPPQTNTLQSISKDRVKIQAKRRPPTRRTASRSGDIFDDDNDVTDSSSHSRTLTDEPPQLVKSMTASVTSVDASKSDKTAVGDTKIALPVPASTAGTSTATTSAVTAGRVVGPVASEASLDFSVPNTTTSKKSAVFPSAADDDDHGDIFGHSSSRKTDSKPQLKSERDVSADVTAATPSDKKLSGSSHQATGTGTKPMKAFDDGDDGDIFHNDSSRTDQVKPDDSSLVPAATTSRLTGVKKAPVVDLDEDIFGDSSLTVSAKKNIKATTAKPVNTYNDDDDIFAVVSGKTTSKSDDKLTMLFGDDDDSLFTSDKSTKQQKSTVIPTVSTRNQPATKSKFTRRDEDLFSDDTDIFADALKGPVAAQPRSKVTATDDDVDIFADVTSYKQSSTAVKSPPSASLSAKKQQAAVVDDIFDDPLNAFGS